jgi:hypothetical protein
MSFTNTTHKCHAPASMAAPSVHIAESNTTSSEVMGSAALNPSCDDCDDNVDD